LRADSLIWADCGLWETGKFFDLKFTIDGDRPG
jgi:hypothetical protein